MYEETLPRPGTAVSSDIVRSSPGGYPRHSELGLAAEEAIGAAIAAAGQPGEWARSSRGDGEMSVAPAGVAPATLLATALPRLAAALVRYNGNKTKEHQLRLRLGLDSGDIQVDARGVPRGGDPLVIAARLQEHPANREAMTAVPDAPICALVSDTVYQRAVPYRALGLDPRHFRRLELRIEGREQIAWLYLPGFEPPDVDGAVRAQVAHEVVRAPAADEAGRAPVGDPKPKPAAPPGGVRIKRSSGIIVGDYGTVHQYRGGAEE
ncbi:hypothetical protein AMIS_69440 [Actinoplanes missouriensis 431]|uniref:Uncharacterized protein n=1 Tax=Actinoplanes missouriensis (strain ATCC 14538 / DSM 43046 / CBS 188.64 / JCM 3121 / NBRC 102363 / NCIMB 12654 / NRRL B-3342 / UNCC 431) TaxID=512565 RepID=I0HGM7_ACTM4|nr:hypothetical protein [Actinoplanes missouriensis]BAL92164.1 hypothetical protein AMIS_69440 [Actinoplanes missouriensis 431]